MDSYIDKDEVQLYGPYAAGKLRTIVIGIDGLLDPVAKSLAAQIEAATAAVKTAVDGSRAADAVMHTGRQKKEPALDEALGVLGRFSKHLDGHKRGLIDRRTFFTADGTVAGVGRGGPKVLASLRHIGGQLKRKDSPVKDAPSWRNEVAHAEAQLAPPLAETDRGRTTRRGMTPEVKRARAAWLNVYSSAKTIVEGFLRLHGKVDLLPQIFHDLAVPTSMHVSSIPAVPPA